MHSQENKVELNIGHSEAISHYNYYCRIHCHKASLGKSEDIKGIVGEEPQEYETPKNIKSPLGDPRYSHPSAIYESPLFIGTPESSVKNEGGRGPQEI